MSLGERFPLFTVVEHQGVYASCCHAGGCQWRNESMAAGIAYRALCDHERQCVGRRATGLPAL